MAVTPTSVFLSGLEEKDKRRKAEEAKKKEERAGSVNPLNVIADAVARFVAAGGPSNPAAYVAASTALINPIKGEQFDVGQVASRSGAGSVAGKALGTPDEGTDFLGGIGSSIGNLAKPENFNKTALFLKTLQGPEKGFEALSALDKLEQQKLASEEATEDRAFKTAERPLKLQKLKADLAKTGSEKGKLRTKANLLNEIGRAKTVDGLNKIDISAAASDVKVDLQKEINRRKDAIVKEGKVAEKSTKIKEAKAVVTEQKSRANEMITLVDTYENKDLPLVLEKPGLFGDKDKQDKITEIESDLQDWITAAESLEKQDDSEYGSEGKKKLIEKINDLIKKMRTLLKESE